MSELKAQPAEFRATIHVTRKATGKVETYELVSVPDEQPKQKDSEHGSHAHNDVP